MPVRVVRARGRARDRRLPARRRLGDGQPGQRRRRLPRARDGCACPRGEHRLPARARAPVPGRARGRAQRRPRARRAARRRRRQRGRQPRRGRRAAHVPRGLPAADLPRHRRGPEHAVLQRVRRRLRPDRREHAALLQALPRRRRRSAPGRVAAAGRPDATRRPRTSITASHDVLRDDGEAYAAALPQRRQLRRVEGTVHGFWRWQTTEIARATVREAAPRSAKR